MKRIVLIFLIISYSALSQKQVSGQVFDQATGKKLPFVTLKSNLDHLIITDSNGKFSFVNDAILELKATYTGYYSKKVDLNDTITFFKIYLKPKATFKDTSLVHNLSISRSIIAKVIANKEANNLQKKFKNFQFKNYNKLIVSANPDSIRSKIDTLFTYKKGQKIIKSIDSSSTVFKKIISKQHLFEIEKVSLFQFSKNILKETIIGTRMAGFEKPIYEVFGFNLQSFSIYDNHYELMETKFLSPISKNGSKNYNFKILDTIIIQNRKIVTVRFENKDKQNLSGLLYIDCENYAIAKAVMQSKGVLEISGTHEFVFDKLQNIWFPSEKIFKLIKGKNDENISVLGGTIQFDGDAEDGFKPRNRVPSDFVYLISRTNIFELQTNTKSEIKKPSIAIEISKNATNRDENFWNLYRKSVPDIRDESTYKFVDSLVTKKRLESKIIFGRKIINGFIPYKFVDIDLKKAINFNNYEGFRICLALVTNEKFSEKYRLEGYTAYGTKDGIMKYNIGAAIRVGEKSNSWIGFAYTDDIQEIASTTFLVEKKQFKLFDTSLLNLSSFYNYKDWKAYIETKLLPKTESVWELSSSRINPKFDYLFLKNNQLYQNFNVTTALVSLQWSPFSDYIQTPIGKIESHKRYPKFNLQLTKSLPKNFNNDFDFLKIDFKTVYEKKYLDGQLTSIVFALGIALGDVPITHLYNNSPNSLNKKKLIQRISIDGDNDFETMYFNEFFSNQFAFFQFKHEFKRFKISKKIKPGLVFISRMAIGTMNNPQQHLLINYKTLDDGFLESGLQLNKIYKGIGLGVFYRYGPNALPDFDDNFAIRFSYKLDFGF